MQQNDLQIQDSGASQSEKEFADLIEPPKIHIRPVELFIKFPAATVPRPMSARRGTASTPGFNNTELLAASYNRRSRPSRSTRSITPTESIGPRPRSLNARLTGANASSKRPTSPRALDPMPSIDVSRSYQRPIKDCERLHPPFLTTGSC